MNCPCCLPAPEGQERHVHDLCEHVNCPDWYEYPEDE